MKFDLESITTYLLIIIGILLGIFGIIGCIDFLTNVNIVIKMTPYLVIMVCIEIVTLILSLWLIMK